MPSHRELLAPNGHHGDQAPAQSWERLPTDTDRSFEAFEAYRQMGAERSLAKVGQKLGKSTPLMERWSKHHHWVERTAAWDRHEARTVNESVLLDTSQMRSRLVNAALALEAKASESIASMSREEIAALSPYEIAALMKTAADVIGRAAEIGRSEFGSPADLPPPQFTIQIIKPGGMVGVQLPNPDGGTTYGYIPADRVEDFRRDHPDGIVLV